MGYFLNLFRSLWKAGGFNKYVTFAALQQQATRKEVKHPAAMKVGGSKGFRPKR